MLNEYVDFRVSAAISFEDKQRRASITPRCVTVPSANTMWADVVVLIDTLKACPEPNLNNDDEVEWRRNYFDWYQRSAAIISLFPAEEEVKLSDQS